LSNKLKTRLAAIQKIKLCVNGVLRKTLVEGLFNSVLCYCLPVFGGASNHEIETLQVPQNKAARLALKAPPRTHRNLMFDELKWMSVSQLIAYHTLITIYRVRSKNAPEYLATQLTNDNRQGQIVLPHSSLEQYRKSFIYRGGTIWNKSSESVRRSRSVEGLGFIHSITKLMQRLLKEVLDTYMFFAQ